MIGALVVALASLAPAQAIAEAPESLLRASGADPKSFVQLLAEAGIPAGLEIRRGDFDRISNSPMPWTTKDWSVEKLAREPRVPIDTLVRAFNRNRLDYRAAVMDGVIVIRPVRSPVAYLDGKAAFSQLEGRGLMRVTEKVFAPLDPALDRPGGRVGSTIGPIGVEVDYGDGMELAVDAVGLTVLGVLNQIGRLAPGHPWIVVTTDGDVPRIDRFGFAHRHGTSTTLGVH